MKIRFECNYCGEKWIKVIDYKFEMENIACGKCDDEDVKKTDLSDSVDYYAEHPSKVVYKSKRKSSDGNQ